MEITWLGHSCFRLRSGDLVVVTDPYSESLGLSMGPLEAQVVTVSQGHPNHSHISGVLGSPKVVRGPGEYEIRGVYISGFLTPPGGDDPIAQRNTAYVVEMEGLRICHLGDVSRPLSGALMAELHPTDVLLAPVGEGCTLPVSQVSELVHSLGPRIVIPMHYLLPGLTAQVGPLELFLKEMGIREAIPQPRLSVTSSTLPQETRVVVLEARGQPMVANR